MVQALVKAFPSRVGEAGPLEGIWLVPSSGGRYEITVDGTLVYSKAETKQHIADDEAIRLIRNHLEATR